MEKKGLPQEGLKLIACITMLLDHMGINLIPWIGMRVVGRIAFPIYCFLLAEGFHYTRSVSRYALRLGLVMVLSELPFDLLVFGRLVPARCSVMVTLLLGLGAMTLASRTENPLGRLAAVIPFVLLADVLGSDYGGYGVLTVLLFWITRERPHGLLLDTLGLLAISLLLNSFPIPFLGLRVPIEVFCLLAMIPIALYSGRKAAHSKALQWAFTLFYPVHLALLALLRFL